MPNLYTPELIADLKRLTKGLPRAEGVKAVGRRLKLSERASRSAYSRYIEAGAEAAKSTSSYAPNQDAREEPPKTRGASISISGDVGEATLTDDNPRTVEELLKACKVDLDVWEVEKHTVNKWEVAMREPATTVGGRGNDAEINESETGFKSAIWTRKSHVPIRVPLYQVKVWLRRKVEASTLNKMLEQFTTKASKFAPRTFIYEKPKKGKADCCYVLNGHDVHIAKLAWGPSTGGADWDIKIARETDDAAVEDLMFKVPSERVEEVVVIVGSDMLQIDNDKSTTTAGTYVDSDSRLAKAFEAAGDMLTSRIEKLASRFKVKVVVIPGNHDSTVSLFLGKYVEAWFRNHPNVEVDSSPKSRKYHAYGKNLIGFDHGSNTKLNDLPLIMMRENQATISGFKHFEVLTGDKHHEFVNDIKGIRVRIAPALCPPDKWHADKGYIGSIRQSQGLLYQRDNGLEAIYYSKSLD